jgi:hypothetical protein
MIEGPVPRKSYVDGLHVFGCREDLFEQRGKLTDSFIQVVTVVKDQSEASKARS